MSGSKRASRREFLKASAVAASVFTIVPRHVLGGRGFVAPSDKVNIALVGAGGQGRTNARELFRLDDAQIVAVADPAESFRRDRFYFKVRSGRVTAQRLDEEQYW